jgi:hypothetical protein
MGDRPIDCAGVAIGESQEDVLDPNLIFASHVFLLGKNRVAISHPAARTISDEAARHGAGREGERPASSPPLEAEAGLPSAEA